MRDYYTMKSTLVKVKRYENNIPQEMKKQSNWCLWKLEDRDGRTTKVPYTINGRGAKSNDSNTWASFHDALHAFTNSPDDDKYNGLGFFLDKPFIGLDIDHASKQDQDKINKILNIVKGTYVEVSQSGNGYHAIFRGFKPKNTPNKKNGCEMYDHGRFFALTADLRTLPQVGLIDGEAMKQLIDLTVGFKQDVQVEPAVGTGNDLSNDEIINRILASSQADQFKQLYAGNITDYSSQSNADLALCNILAYWTNRDAQQIDSLFRQSKLYRSKWDSKRGATTYGEMTIQKAVDGTPNGYSPNTENTGNYIFSFNQAKPKMKAIADNKIVPINGSVAPVLDQETRQKDNWTKHFIYKKTQIGDAPEIKSTAVKNALLIINNDAELKNIFKFNEFTQNVEVSIDKSIDLRKYGSGVIKFHKENLRDIDITNLGLYIESSPKYKVTFKTQLLYDAVEASARQHSYNPIVDYMNECKKNWDGKHRLDDFFPTFLGAERSNTTNLITRLWFMGGVAKAYYPKAKFDYVLDLVGGQGAGKTTLLHRSAPLGLYTDQFTSFTDKDDLANMKDAFIVNDDEMDASNKSGFAEVKKFITLQTFKYRKPYGRATEEYAKHFIIARTTNEKAHLRDRSGDRRFMTILVNQKKQEKFPYTDLNEDYIKQIWGEAVHLYEASEDPFDLSESDEKLLKENREQFIQTTALEDKLNETIASDFADKDFIIPSNLAYSMFDDGDYFIRHRKEASEINYYMEHLGYVKKVRKINGKSKKVFFYIGE